MLIFLKLQPWQRCLLGRHTAPGTHKYRHTQAYTHTVTHDMAWVMSKHDTATKKLVHFVVDHKKSPSINKCVWGCAYNSGSVSHTKPCTYTQTHTPRWDVKACEQSGERGNFSAQHATEKRLHFSFSPVWNIKPQKLPAFSGFLKNATENGAVRFFFFFENNNNTSGDPYYK